MKNKEIRKQMSEYFYNMFFFSFVTRGKYVLLKYTLKQCVSLFKVTILTF